MDPKLRFPFLLEMVLGLILCSAAVEAKEEAFATQFLEPHNKARREVGASIPDLVWDSTLAEYAQWWADLQASKGCILEHSSGIYGENIYWASFPSSPADAVDAWVSEKAFWGYAKNSCALGEKCGHYTQIVWRNTRELGCASSLCNGGGTFTVCSYNPPGNYQGELPY